MTWVSVDDCPTCGWPMEEVNRVGSAGGGGCWRVLECSNPKVCGEAQRLQRARPAPLDTEATPVGSEVEVRRSP